MADGLRIYGGEAKFRAALDRHLATGRELLDLLEGVKRRMAAAEGSPTGLHAELLEIGWISDVEQWQTRAARAAIRHLQDGAEASVPNLGSQWPPDTGKPRHRRRIEWVEPWLRDSIDELERLRDSIGRRARPPAATAPAAPAGPIDRLTRVRALLTVGETPTVEFKSTLIWSIQGGVTEARLQKMVTKTIAAFANGDGGTLLIGVGPDGAVVGLDPDCAVLRRPGDTCVDAFSRALAGVVGVHLGQSIAASIVTDYVEVGGNLVCVVDVAANDRAVYLKSDGGEHLTALLCAVWNDVGGVADVRGARLREASVLGMTAASRLIRTAPGGPNATCNTFAAAQTRRDGRTITLD
jgi:Putative DNA-binding domain